MHDYVKFEDDEVDKYLVKQKANLAPKPDPTINMANFSIMLDEYIGNSDKDPFEFSVIKPGERISYA